MGRLVASSCVVLVLSFAVPAFAQTERRVGVTLGYPAQVGLLWQITDRVAVRPQISFTTGENEFRVVAQFIGPGGSQESTSTSQTGHTAINTELTVLLALKSWDALKIYAAPSYGYGRTSFTTETSRVSLDGRNLTTKDESTNHTHLVRGSLGVQFTPHDRFAIFGESGVSYSSFSSETFGRSSSRAFGTAGSVGVVFYF